MAVISPQRQPFAELGVSRLQSLSSAKNRQNAITELLASPSKGKLPLADCGKINLTSPSKRPFSPSIFEDEDEDAENIDPATSPSIKRSKNLEGLPISKAEPLFNINVNSNPGSPLKPKTTPPPFNFPSAPSSAPAGRLPKHKRVGLLSKKRTSLSPYKRVDPPPFGSNKARSGGLPFSIDAAISGTLGKNAPTLARPSKVPTLEEAMPKGWFFDIHEDTPDEEAAILMEHSTCTLDISSDDEAGPSRAREERGKENIPPPDFTPVPSLTAAEAMPAKSRRSIHVDAMADDGDERAPLGTLPAEDFYAHGLDKDSVEVITDHTAADTPETPVTTDDDDFDPADKENRLDTLEAVPSPSRHARFAAIDSTTDAEKHDFVIAEDP